MGRLLRSLFNVEPEESRTALLLFSHCMCVVAAAFIIGRSIGNTLFLQRVDNRFLPYTYVVAALAVSAMSAVYARFAGRVRSDRLIAATALLAMVVVLATRGALVIAPTSLPLLGFVYVLFDIIGDIAIIQVWTLAGDLFTARQAKRLFAVVGAGGTVAGVVFGALMSASVRLLGTSNLLFVVALLLVCIALIARAIGKNNAHRLEVTQSVVLSSQVRGGLAGDVQRVLRSPYLVAIAALIAVVTVVSVLVDYQWKLTANAAYAGDENGLAAYFGMFCMVTNGLAFFVQVFIASRLLERYGIRAGLSLLPLLLVLATLGLLLFPVGAAALWAASAAKGGDGTLRYSVQNASMEMLYRPVGSFRPRAKAIIDGIAKPIWAAVGGLIIALVAAVVAPRHLGALTISLIVGWLVLAAIVRRHYVASLEATLRSRRALDPDAARLDRTTIEALEQALSSSDERQVANALTLLESFPASRWDPPIASLLESEDPTLRRRAVEYVARRGGAAVPKLEGLVQADDPQLAGAALAAIINHVGEEDRDRAAERLAAMCNAESPSTRVAAARALGLCHAPQTSALCALATDASVDVRLQAAKSSQRLAGPSEALTDALVNMLEDPRTRNAAAEALVPIGVSLLERLEPYLTPLTPRRTQVAVIEILGRIPHERALARITEAMGHERERTRHAAIATRCRLARETRTLVDEAPFVSRLEVELRDHFQRHVVSCELGDVEPLLLGEALTLRQRRTAERVLHLVSALHPETDFQLVRSALASPKDWLRANAVELLDNTIGGEHRPAVLALFDDLSAERRLAVADELFADLRHLTRETWLDELSRDEDPWVAACAIYEAARDGADLAPELCQHPQPLVRQTAIAARDGELQLS